jgi:hypothetical protein
MNVLYEVGRVLDGLQREDVDPDAAKRKFDGLVRATALGQKPEEGLTVEEVFAIGDLNRRREDKLPSDVSHALGLEPTATYSDAILSGLTEVRMVDRESARN